MSASPASHLKLIDVSTGEITEHACAGCAKKEDELDELFKKMRGLAHELAVLRRDKLQDARDHQAWPTLYGLFQYWQELSGHTRVKWTTKNSGASKFWIALPLWEEWGTGNFAASIAGLIYQPYEESLKNKKKQRYDDWETLCKDSASIRRYIQRRPADWTLPSQFEDKQ
jgi:hypothetical protein